MLRLQTPQILLYAPIFEERANVVNQCETVVAPPNSCRLARRQTTTPSFMLICGLYHPQTKYQVQMALTNIDGNETFNLPTQGKPALVTDLTRHDMQPRIWSPAWDNNHLP